MSLMHIFLLSVLIGFLASLPTGPMGAYIIARRIEHSFAAMITAIVAAITVNVIAIILIQHYGSSFADIISGSTLLIMFGAILIISLGAVRIIHPGSFAKHSIRHLPASHKQHSETLSINTMIRTFGTGFIMNSLNPMMAITIISLLTTFQVIGTRSTVLPVVAGFCIGAITLWAFTDFLLERSIKKAHHSLSIILRMCGIIMVISGVIALYKVM